MQRELTWGKLWPHGARPSFRRQSQKTVSGMHGSGRASLSTDVCILLTDNKLSRRMEPWGQTLRCVTWGLEGYLIEKWLQTPAESEVSHHCQMCQPTLPSKSQTWCCSLWATRLKPGKGDGCSEGIQEGLTTPLWAEDVCHSWRVVDPQTGPITISLSMLASSLFLRSCPTTLLVPRISYLRELHDWSLHGRATSLFIFFKHRDHLSAFLSSPSFLLSVFSLVIACPPVCFL